MDALHFLEAQANVVGDDVVSMLNEGLAKRDFELINLSAWKAVQPPPSLLSHIVLFDTDDRTVWIGPFKNEAMAQSFVDGQAPDDRDYFNLIQLQSPESFLNHARAKQRAAENVDSDKGGS